jgi:hypothetical protein
MATLNLGRIKPVFRGAYSGSTAYVVDDIVTHGNESFICIQAHGAGTQATSVTAYWTKLAAKGTDGTDLTSTLTTVGDIVYHDGSSLARLARGAANQELRMNSGATAPEWYTPAVVSSDFTLLSTVTASNTAVVSFDGFYSATYKDYMLKITNALAATTGQDAYMRIRESAADVTASNYRGWASGSERYSGGPNYGNQGISWYDTNYMVASGHSGSQHNNTTYGGYNAIFHIFDPLSASQYKWIHGSYSYYNDTGQNVIGGQHRSVVKNTAASSGISFYMGSGNVASGTFKLYGYK